MLQMTVRPPCPKMAPVTPTVAFLLIVSFLVLASGMGHVLSRRLGGTWFAALVCAGFAGVGAHLFCAWRPETVAPLIAGTDLALLYPGLGYAFGIVLLFVLGPRAGARNHRAVSLFGGFVSVGVIWSASGLLGDPALGLGAEEWEGECCLQSTGWSCAPAAACSLLRRLGVEAGESEMARLMQARPHFGTDILNMHRGLARKLRGTGYRVELRHLDYARLMDGNAPCLVSIELHFFMDHAMAVVDADEAGVSVLDPLSGPDWIPRDRFEEIWRKKALLVLPEEGG